MTAEIKKRILLVDDNNSIRKQVTGHLSDRGYEIVEAVDGIQGLQKGLTVSPDLIVLDVVMPGMDGFKLCRALRENGVDKPIIMLTDRAEIEDKVQGFSLGADDYLAKPFDSVELELRIQALLRRSQPDSQTPSGTIDRGGLKIDLDRHTVTVDGRDAMLTPIEFNILKLLAAAPGRVYSRHDLLTSIWETDYDGYKRNIDPHVNRVRIKIEENPRKPKYILTVWGVGYKFNDALPEN